MKRPQRAPHKRRVRQPGLPSSSGIRPWTTFGRNLPLIQTPERGYNIPIGSYPMCPEIAHAWNADGASRFLDRVAKELGRIDTDEVQKLSELIHECYLLNRFVFVIGNGGSGSNASHFCEDLGKGTLQRADFDNDAKRRIKILSLTDNTPYILAWANDEGFDRVFVEQLKNLAAPGDLLVAISGSGNSPNILRAVEWANRNGLMTFGCTGFSGGKLRETGQIRPARAARRHGHRRIDPPDGVPLGRRRFASALVDVTTESFGRRIGYATTKTGSPRTSILGSIPSPGLIEAAIRPFTRFGAPSAMLTVT